MRADHGDGLAGHRHAICGLAQVQVVRHRLGNDGIQSRIVEALQPVTGDRAGSCGGFPRGWPLRPLRQGLLEHLGLRRRCLQRAAAKREAEDHQCADSLSHPENG